MANQLKNCFFTGNERKKGVVLSYINMLVQILVNIAYTPIMLRLVGQSEYGIYSLCVSFISYLGLLNLGMNSVYVRYYAKCNNDEKKIAELNGLFLIVFLVIAIVVFFVGMVITGNPRSVFGTELSNDEIVLSQILLSIMVVNLAIAMPSSVFSSFIAVHEKFVFQRGLTLLQSLSTPFLTLPLLFLGYGSIAMVSVATLLTIIQLALNVFFCLKFLNTKFVLNKFNFRFMKEIFGFSFFIFLQTLMDQMNWQIDKFILANIVGSAAVAVYAVGTQFNFFFMQFACSISSVFTPQIHKLIVENQHRDVDLLMAKIGRIQFIIVGFVFTGFVFVGQAFISLWAGIDYKDSYYVAVLIMAPLVITLSQNLGHEICRAKNVHRVRCMVDLFFSFINLGISIPLVKYYGVLGAAFATFVVMSIQGTLFAGWYLHKIAKIDYLYVLRERLKLLPSMMIPCIVGFYVMVEVNLYDCVRLMGFAVGYTFVFFSFVYIWGMNTYEKSLLNKMLSRAYR